LRRDRRLLLHLTLCHRFFTEYCNCELSVIETATSVSVVGLKEGTQLILRVIHAALFEYALELGEVDSTCVHDVKVLKHLHKARLLRHLRI